ncbi:TIGR04211 family SH3 domain-containing protein [Thiohalospira sp.]|uniref:TIGR04211 family SH3 domain-containing protein n=1 Tax=Thiohalospira sp. TaxID=3080549 RepID=UPI00397EADE5
MRYLLLALILLLGAQPALAETTHWVRDVLYVTLRDGPGSDKSVVTVLESGDGIEKIEEGEDGDYVRVRTDDGEEGWIQEKYLSEERTAAQQLTQVRAELDRVTRRRDELSDELEEVTAERDELTDQVEELEETLESRRDELEEVRSAAERPMEISDENEELRSENKEMETELKRLQAEVADLEGSENRDWFLVGAGVLLAGLILGVILPHLRSRRSGAWDF